MKEKEYVTWNQVKEFVTYIADLSRFNGIKYSGVYGLPRGGLVLAVMLSHQLDIPLLMSPASGCLIVDDICDTGESLLHYVKNSSGDKVQDYRIATMYYKQNSLGVVPDTYFYRKEDNWVVFPWEMEEK